MTNCYANIDSGDFKSANYNNNKPSIKLKVVPPLILPECPVCFDKSDLYDSDYCCEMMCLKCCENMADEYHEIYASTKITVKGRKGTYYCLYGGGPEGGFFVTGEGENENCYDIERDWGTEFTITRHYQNAQWDIVEFESSVQYLKLIN